MVEKKATPKVTPKAKTKVDGPLIFKIGILVIGLSLVVLLYLRFFWEKPRAAEDEMVKLQKSLQDIRAAMNVDSVRQFTIQKVMQIISRYNKDMPSSQKYEIADEVYKMSVKYTNLDVDLICATITYASGRSWDAEVVSSTGAMGLMQIMPITGMWVAHYEGITWTSPEEILFDPIYNIRIGSRLLSSYIDAYDLEGGLAAYNGSEQKAALWLASNKAKGILWTETNNYIPYVLKLYEEYKSLTL